MMGLTRVAGLAAGLGMTMILAVGIGADHRAAQAQDVGNVWLTYTVFHSGLRLANVDVLVAAQDDAYRGRIDIQTTGLVGLVTNWRYVAETTGRIENGMLRPLDHTIRSVKRDRTRRTHITYDADGPVEITPPIPVRRNRTPVPPDTLIGSIDIVSAIISVMANGDPDQPCAPPTPIFDGRHRFDLLMESAGGRRFTGSRHAPYVGAALGCVVTMRALGGFKSGGESFNPDGSFDAWFADVLDDGRALLISLQTDFLLGRSFLQLSRIRDSEGRTLFGG